MIFDCMKIAKYIFFYLFLTSQQYNYKQHSKQRLFSFFFKAFLIQRPRIYLFVKLLCFRGFTKIGKTITPTVKRQIGATTINIDSKDIRKSDFIYK